VSGVDRGEGGLEGSRSAQQVLEAESRRGAGIPTFCRELDGALGGGVKLGQVTEFCGVPGVGKTQLGMQLAVDALMPGEFGGLGGEAVYVDTEGSFTADRCLDLARAARGHMDRRAAAHPDEGVRASLQAAAAGFDPEEALGRITYYRTHDYAEQLALVAHLPQLLGERPRARVVIIDSVSFHFRVGFTDLGKRSRVLAQMAQSLMSAADKHDVAVVLMNQVTTRVSPGGGPARLVPALGDSWGHCATSRVILFWKDGQTYAHLHKCPFRPSATVPYCVTEEGIRDRRASRKRHLGES